MIETVENIEGVLQEQASLTGNIVDGGSINGNLDSVGNIMKEKDVNFYDYDGSLVYSYTADEFLNMYAFPPNPKHRGLISEGWNWTLENAREYVQNYGKLALGQLYNVEGDGALIGITLTDNDLRASYNQDCDYGEYDPETGTWGDDIYYYSYIMELYLPLEEESEDKYVIVDWGDGSTDTWYGRDEYDEHYISHIYNYIGDYEIKITPINDAVFCVEPYHDYCEEVIKYAHLGRNEKQIVDTSGSYPYPGTYFFKNCNNLKYITALNTFGNVTCCPNLTTIIYPRGQEDVDIQLPFTNSISNIIFSDTIYEIWIYNEDIYMNSIKNIYVPPSWQTLSIIITGFLDNIIIPDTRSSNPDVYYLYVQLNNSRVNNLRLPRIVYNSHYYGMYNGLEITNSTISTPLTLPINANTDNFKTMYIENSFVSEYLYLPPGITKFGYNSSSSNYYNYKINNSYPTQDVKIKSLKVIDCRDYTEVPTLQSSYDYFYDGMLKYIIVPDDLIDEWSSATNWSNFYYWFITASDYENIQRRAEE